jgi:plasmid maintenance system antidote protein VapI
MKRYRLDRRRTGHRRVDSAPVVEHVSELVGAKWSHRQIAVAARCAVRTISSLASDTYPTIEARLASRILAARPTIHGCPPCTYIEATGSMRRVRALIAFGHTLTSIANAIGMSRGNLNLLVTGRRTRIFAEHAKAIVDVYATWERTPGTNARAKNRGAALNWHTPDYWEDVDGIDDPAFDPDASTSRAQQVAENATWLLEGGLDRDQVAERLGVSRFYVDRALREARKLEAAA